MGALTRKTFSWLTKLKPAYVACRLLSACRISPSAVNTIASSPSGTYGTCPAPRRLSYKSYVYHVHLIILLHNTSFYGSSCANNGKDALNTPDHVYLMYRQMVSTTTHGRWGPTQTHDARKESTGEFFNSRETRWLNNRRLWSTIPQDGGFHKARLFHKRDKGWLPPLVD
eukprot:1183770-Prorocentrum_minimum.AAC.3